jgi:hypothetical protein
VCTNKHQNVTAGPVDCVRSVKCVIGLELTEDETGMRLEVCRTGERL